MSVPLAARLGAACLTLALAAGCSSSPEPSPVAQTPSPTPSPTATVTPSAPALPAAAQGTSRRAAVAFVKHWIATLNYAGDTLDTRPLKAISAPGCEVCGSIIESVSEVRRSGGEIRNQQWTGSEFMLLRGSKELAQVNVVIDMAPSSVIRSERAKPERYEGATKLYTFELRPLDGGWRLWNIAGSEA